LPKQNDLDPCSRLLPEHYQDVQGMQFLISRTGRNAESSRCRALLVWAKGQRLIPSIIANRVLVQKVTFEVISENHLL